MFSYATELIKQIYYCQQVYVQLDFVKKTSTLIEMMMLQ